VRGNKGARTAGVDGVTPRSIGFGAGELLAGLREDLKADRFVPQRVREKAIPKASGKVRRLGIPTTVDRIVQASVKLVLEPIFEADFQPCSYGFRPRRRAQDAIAEIHYLASPSRNYEWVFEADIKACFDEIDHPALMGRVRERVGDKRVLGWVKEFLRAGILTEQGLNRETITGTPQGGILSPLLANIALSVLDEHFAARWAALGPDWQRRKHRRAGRPAMKMVRYADDFVVLIAGTRDDAEALCGEVGAVLAPMGLRLSEEKTRLCRVDEGFDFLGWHIQRRFGEVEPESERSTPTRPRRRSRRSRTRCGRSLAGLTSNACRPVAPPEPGAAGLVQLLPARRVLADVQLRRPFRLLADRRLAPQTARRPEHAHPGPALPAQLGSARRGSRDVPATGGRDRALPLPGTRIPTPWSSAPTTGSPAPAA
jgi:RNA-directed DNA polymerase